MKVLTRSLALLCLLATPLVAAPKKIVFISHLSSHGNGQHEYAAGCQLIGKWLVEAYGEDQVSYEHHLIWPEDPEAAFNDAATVVFFCTGGNGHLVNKHVREFDAVMKRGVGLACLHYGVEVPIGPPGKGMLNWMGGYFETHWSVNPHWVADFDTFTDHPAANGLTPFESNDEWYFHMRFRGDMEGITPILSAKAPEATMKRPDGPHSGNPNVRKAVAAGEPQHVAWTYQRGTDYGNGRGFGFTGLHYHKNFINDSFRKTVLNGIAWTAHLAIPEGGIDSETPSEESLQQSIVDTAKLFGKEIKPRPKRARAGKGNDKQAEAKKKQASVVKPVFSSEPVTTRTPGHAVPIEADITGSRNLYLVVTDAGNGFSCDWANWVEPRLVGPKGEKKLTTLPWTKAETDWGRTRVNQNVSGGVLRVAGKPLADGIGTHAFSLIAYQIPDGYTTFRASGALDDGGSRQGDAASVAFHVFTQDPDRFLQEQRQRSRQVAGGADASQRLPENALAALDTHPDLEASLFAAEPMLMSPSSIDIDHRGRVWVCEVVNYRRHQGRRPQGDRILILEDTDADGKADVSKVFYQGNDIDSAHGICVLGNRVLVSANNEVFSLYDDDGDDKADRKEVLFTNIGGSQHDHGIHALMFGPDGRLYFNFGNAAKRLCDRDGNIITDLAGNPVVAERKPYQEGMIFRCALDGTQVETLAWNFRNNWEVAVDSYGALWQSDNDDDGNRGVRINFVMEYGNYGYRDEITGAGWRADRLGKHTEIPLMHWHLRDPGVVPNLLQTGAGSPTGITIYEGERLPSVFHGQILHCDAGPNVCRAYPVTNDGAGYRAEIVSILSSTQDRWYRPSDVAVAPDGSLIIADWYDPGVGGHGMGDLERGRLYRVTPKGNAAFKMPTIDVSSTEGAIAALKSPNNAARYLGWQALCEDAEGRRAARTLFRDTEAAPYHRARALFLLGWHRKAWVPAALNDNDPNIRMAGLRLARQFDSNVLESIERLVHDPDPQVRRECAIALRFLSGPKADALWAQLARQHDGKDRWYLEALGIGADLHWDSRLAALGDELTTAILWRSRGRETAHKLVAATLAAETDVEVERFLRAFHFQPDSDAKQDALLELFTKGSENVAVPVAFMIDPRRISDDTSLAAKAQRLVESLAGYPAALIPLVARLGLENADDHFHQHILSREHPDQESILAAKALLRDPRAVKATMSTLTGESFARFGRALGATGEARGVNALLGELQNDDRDLGSRQALVGSLTLSSRGEKRLLTEAEAGRLPTDLHFTAAAVLGRSRDQRVRESIAKALDLPPTPGAEKFPPIPQLVQVHGNPSQGAAAFIKATCATCHVVDGKGIDFGPDLSEIGDKLSVEGLYEAILYPNNAISHGFQGIILTVDDGSQFGGYLVSETDDETALRMPGGITQTIEKATISKRHPMDQSLMPPGLAATLSTQELADLVAYLVTLKN